MYFSQSVQVSRFSIVILRTAIGNACAVSAWGRFGYLRIRAARNSSMRTRTTPPTISRPPNSCTAPGSSASSSQAQSTAKSTSVNEMKLAT